MMTSFTGHALPSRVLGVTACNTSPEFSRLPSNCPDNAPHQLHQLLHGQVFFGYLATWSPKTWAPKHTATLHQTNNIIFGKKKRNEPSKGLWFSKKNIFWCTALSVSTSLPSPLRTTSPHAVDFLLLEQRARLSAWFFPEATFGPLSFSVFCDMFGTSLKPYGTTSD